MLAETQFMCKEVKGEHKKGDLKHEYKQYPLNIFWKAGVKTQFMKPSVTDKHSLLIDVLFQKRTL